MSSRNDEVTGMAMALAFVGVAVMVAAMILFAMAAFACLVLTVLCLCAWNEPLRLGRATLEPENARAFIYAGLLGAVGAPLFVVFCSLLFDVHVQAQLWPYIVLGGYVGMSMAELADQQEESASQVIDHGPPAQIAPPPPARPAPRQPFEFASWDDEEELG